MELGNSRISTDAQLLEVMLFNLLENTIHFSFPEQKEAWVKVEITETELGQIAISIADNGMGIPIEVSNKVFEMFVVGTQDGKGDGIGLYEAQVIAERLKGKIWLKNSEKGFTEFEVILPSSYGER